MAQGRDRARPQAESAVHVDPGLALVRDVRDLAHGIEGARVDVAGLGADDRGPAQRGQRAPQLVHVHPALAVGSHAHRAAAAQAEHAQRGDDGDVRLLADHDVHEGRAREAVLLDVPARAREHGVSARGQAGEVRHLTAGHEAHAAGGGEAEELEQPARGHLFRHGHGRAAGVQAGVLVPGRDQPVRGQRGGHAPADDEAEVARPRAGDQAGLGVGGQPLQHLRRVRAPRRQRPAQRRAQSGQVRARAHRPRGQPLQVPAGQGGRPRQQVGRAHARRPECIDTSRDILVLASWRLVLTCLAGQ